MPRAASSGGGRHFAAQLAGGLKQGLDCSEAFRVPYLPTAAPIAPSPSTLTLPLLPHQAGGLLGMSITLRRNPHVHNRNLAPPRC
jgi:hypothetical protein